MEEITVSLKHKNENSNNPISALDDYEFELPQHLYRKRALLLQRMGG